MLFEPDRDDLQSAMAVRLGEYMSTVAALLGDPGANFAVIVKDGIVAKNQLPALA